MEAPRSGPPQGPPPSPQAPRLRLLWWWMWIALLLWNLTTLWPRLQPEVKLPYSIVLAQVRSGNVARIHVTGDEITGDFVRPFIWPRPEAQSAPAAPSPGAPAPSEPAPRVRPAPATYPRFKTVFPEAIGDPSLLPLLEAHHVEVEVDAPASPWLTLLLANGVPVVLLVLFFLWMGQRAAQSQANVFGFGRARARRLTGDRPRVTFADVSGVDEAKADLQEEVEFLRHPQKYYDLGARLPRGSWDDSTARCRCRFRIAWGGSAFCASTLAVYPWPGTSISRSSPAARPALAAPTWPTSAMRPRSWRPAGIIPA